MKKPKIENIIGVVKMTDNEIIKALERQYSSLVKKQKRHLKGVKNEQIY